MTAGDLIGRDRGVLAVEDGIEDIEEHGQTPALEGRGRKARRKTHGRRACQSAVEALDGAMAQVDRVVADEHIGERATLQGVADPEAMRAVDIAENEMTAGRKCSVSQDDRPGVDIEWRCVGDLRRRRIEDDGRGDKRRLPERGLSRGEGGRRAWES